MIMIRTLLFTFIISIIFYGCSDRKFIGDKYLEESFRNPPDSVRTMVLWDWFNGNVSREGITKDLESMKEVGIGGVVWRGIGGKWWAPQGEAKPYTPKWDSLMQWAILEADRLGLQFQISQDFGYGSGGSHITPDISMQKIYFSQIVLKGGQWIDTVLIKPALDEENIDKAWLRPERELSNKVLESIERIDSYNDLAVIAVPYSSESASYRIPQMNLRIAMDAKTWFKQLEQLDPPAEAVIPAEKIIDLTNQIDREGNLTWNAPEGKWTIIRIGHASKLLMTRPSPAEAVGLECTRLDPEGINTHFEVFLKPILDKAGALTGKTLTHVFLDSWEARSQNWSKEFNNEFYKRRNYDIRPWLPVLAGIVVESPEMTERFLWDFRKTVSELALENYIGQLKKLVEPYGMKLNVEAYGNFNVNTLKFAEMADFQMCEFWAMGDDKFPTLTPHKYYNTMKVMASAAHTTGRVKVGAEAFTGNRGWKDHPYIYKGVGDEAFSRGVNQFILHLSAHQAYENMIPGLTHQKWGGHFNRHNTWWEYSKPWNDYIGRSQFLLQQGMFFADFIYFFGEGAPLHVEDMELDLPAGYDYDVCSEDILQQMKVKNGKIVLPTGISYSFLVLPNTDRITLSSIEKIKELARSGANVIAQKRFTGMPGLSGFPKSDDRVKEISQELWTDNQIITNANWGSILNEKQLGPDFAGQNLNYIHRKINDIDIYFVANPEPEYAQVRCSFRVSNKVPELWNPETGEIREFIDYEHIDGQTSVNIEFQPMQSWFVVFRKSKPTIKSDNVIFSTLKPVITVEGPWKVEFNPQWGGPKKPVIFDNLEDWSQNMNKGVRFYSGTATYRNSFNVPEDIDQLDPLFLDLGDVEVMAKVKMNGIECGIVWKPPYRVNITEAVQKGENKLEIDIVNVWVNRMIGDEHYPEDCEWYDWIRLKEWPEWFLNKDIERPTSRYTFTTVKHYDKDEPLMPSGLLGPVRIKTIDNAGGR